ncbi:MAG: response regulator [Elusimicrobia bacterium]|nr:response regulator [Elusimicrobiota bacterium]
MDEKKINLLVVDDDDSIREMLSTILKRAGYEVFSSANGSSAIKEARNCFINLAVCDYNLPDITGLQIAKELKVINSDTNIILMTGQATLEMAIEAIRGDVDEYLIKPIDPGLLKRAIKSSLEKQWLVIENRRLLKELKDANPLTGLPGNLVIMNKIEEKIKKQIPCAILYLDIDNFKSYNDYYGYIKGDEAIGSFSNILKDCIENEDFIGHIGGDDFIIVTTPGNYEKLCNEIIKRFDNLVPSFYDEEARKKGYILTPNRKGEEEKFPLMSISIAVVDTSMRTYSHLGEISKIGAELKKYAKTFSGSIWVKDKR